jgi:hypothetical protein
MSDDATIRDQRAIPSQDPNKDGRQRYQPKQDCSQAELISIAPSDKEHCDESYCLNSQGNDRQNCLLAHAAIIANPLTNRISGVAALASKI